MEIYAKFSLNREEGKTESTENVEAELQRALEDVGAVDVEDSVYDITDVEIVENPKKRSGGATAKVDLGEALLRLSNAYFEARPVALDFGDPESHEKAESRKRNIEMLGPEETALDNAIFHLLNQASEAIQKAKVAALKGK